MTKTTAAMLAALTLLLFAPAAASGMMDDMSKEFEFVSAMIKTGVDNGDVKAFETAHRTLANLDVTADKLDTPRDRTLAYLSIAYFYVRMCGTLPLLQLSKTTNPSGFKVDCVSLSEKYLDKAVKSAESGLTPKDAADTHFYAGLGYDALRGSLSAIPGRDTSTFHKKAETELQTAVSMGTSFDGAKTVLSRFTGADQKSGKPLVSPETFIQIHRLFYLDRALTPPSTLDYLRLEPLQTPSADGNPNTYIDYSRRFIISKPDDTWEFATGTARTNFRLMVRQKQGHSTGKPPLTLVAHELTTEEAALPLKDLVTRSTTLLIEAGYSIEAQAEMDFKGNPAYEIVLVSSYKDLGLKGSQSGSEPEAGFYTKHYMFIVVSSGIEYILSFNTLVNDYAKVFPDLKMIQNTFSPF